ncbi:hypothetical protein ABIA69_000781 [Lysinibacillus parviboronicapiens]|uniref:Uncharacterized protein n=1 Tax=Lysinibacillus parviboronicapiens TaxID=436516 RepID=A0ABV2PG34_9BACI
MFDQVAYFLFEALVILTVLVVVVGILRRESNYPHKSMIVLDFATSMCNICAKFYFLHKNYR